MQRLTSLALAAAISALGAVSSISAQSPLCTLIPFVSNNGGNLGGMVFFDINVTNPMSISGLDTNYSALVGTAVGMNVYLVPGTWVGNENNQAAWTLVASDDGTAVSAGTDAMTSITLAAPWIVTPGSYGIAIEAVGSAHRYNGLTGTPPPQTTFTNSDLSIITGGALNVPWVGSPFVTRTWNGCVHYTLGNGLFASFTADTRDIGPGATVNFTDTSFSSDPGGIIATDWDFDGDGLVDATGANVAHTYPANLPCSPQDVTITVTDATGSVSRTETGYIRVGAPVASFDTAALAQNPLVVQFTDTSEGNPTAWDWDLDGDGVFGDSTVANPAWAYPIPGLYTVALNATNACGTSQATFDIDTRSLLCTTYAGGNGLTATGTGAGNMFDLDITNAAGVTINALGGHYDVAGASVSVDVYTTPGTYVGNELTAASWTLVSSGTGVAAGAGAETILDIDPFYLAQGTYGVLVHVITSAGGLDYTTGNGTNEVYVGLDMTFTAGNGMNGPFSGFINSIRVWNGCIGYSIGQSAASTTGLGGGCANSTGATATHVAEGYSMPIQGAPITYVVNDAPANQAIAGILFGFSSLGGVDLGVIGAPGCLLFPAAVATIPIATDANGSASVTLNMGATPLGTSFFSQAAIADIGHNGLGVVLSDALESTVGN